MNWRFRTRSAAPALITLATLVLSANAQDSAPPPAPAPASSTPSADAGYNLKPGPFEVKTTDLLVLHDEARDKDLEILVRVPTGAAAAGKKLPLVLFSHGMGGSRKAFADLTEHWASWGYVVILPTHADSAQLMRREGKDVSAMLTQRGAARTVDPPGRVKDLSFILDSLDEIETQAAGLAKGAIDRDRIAVAGHSAGALTAQLAFGMTARTKASPLKATSIADERFKAAIIVSGQGVSRGWIGTDAWKNITRPMMVLTGSQDVVSVSKETPQTRRHPYEYAPDGNKYLLFIEGATHSSYQGPSQRPSVKDPPHIDKIQAIVTAGTTAFLDAYLGDGLGASERGRAYLQSDQLPRFSGGLLEYKRK
jgi:predicted dienelactone hydrolase